MRTTRRTLQLGFVLLTLAGVFVVRGNAERWCPFGGVEAIYGYITDGNLICSLGVSNFYVLAAVVLITLLLRRAFCGYLCPIGAISEWLSAMAKRLGLRPRRVPYRLDRLLAMLKYVVLGVILWFTWRASELVFRGYDPCYALIGRHGEDVTVWTYVVAGAVVLASLFVLLPFCRWFCPLAAVFAPFSRVALTRVKRSPAACSECGACGRVCPMGIQVDRVSQVVASRCVACMECIGACPHQGTGAIEWGPPRWLGGRWPQSALVVVLLLCVSMAVAAVYAFPMPSFVWARGESPHETASVQLAINHLNCRGNASLLVYFLSRDDELEIPGYVRLDAWPGPDPAAARITFDPAQTDERAIRDAIVEPYFDLAGRYFRTSPFAIDGGGP